ncbi:MAG: DUF2779 domain-containing protein, partial [Ginsengibacter sp.]
MYGVQCTKRLWLHKYLPKERDVQSDGQTRIFQQGTDIGVLAQQLFPGGINAEPENYYSYQKSVADTERYFRNGHQIIYEAAFQFNGILCAVDLLIKTNHKWYAYEVKSTNSVKAAHIYDAALQYYVITNSGIDLADFSIIHLNKEYIRFGALDIKQLFHPVSVLKEVNELNAFVSSKSLELLEVLSKNTPPQKEVGEHCMIPYPCDFQGFCNKGVFPMQTISTENASADIDMSFVIKNLRFPVSFLSLDTWSSAVPQYDGHWPYKQVCYQFSIHRQSAPFGPLDHYYFIEEDMNSQQKEFIESLLNFAGKEGSIVVHNSSFVKYHLQELKKNFPTLEKEINSVQLRIIELNPPFQKDFVLEEILEKELKQEKHFKTFPVVHNQSILEHSSAAAAWFNLRNEVDKEKI